MKKIILIPTLIFPFLILFILISMFISSSVPAFNKMWENLFSNNVYVALGMILILFVLIMIINVIYLIVGIKNKYDGKELAKSLMIIKLIQIPAYIGIFIIGVLCLLTIFTLPIVLFLFFLDCLCVILTGVLLLLVIIRSKQEEAIFQIEAIAYSLLSFCFVLDVIASIMLFIRNLKNVCNIN